MARFTIFLVLWVIAAGSANADEKMPDNVQDQRQFPKRLP